MMIERVQMVVKHMTFAEADSADLVFSDATKIRLDHESGTIKLKADVTGFYPLDAELFVRTDAMRAGAFRGFTGFQVNVLHPRVEGEIVTSCRFRLVNGADLKYWNGTKWTTPTLSGHWNTEAEVAANIDKLTEPRTNGGFWGVVVNLRTTDRTVTPEVSDVRFGVNLKVHSWLEDMLYRSLAQDLKAKLRPVTDFTWTMPADSNQIDVGAMLAATGIPFNVVGVESVVDKTDPDQPASVNLNEAAPTAFAPGAKISTVDVGPDGNGILIAWQNTIPTQPPTVAWNGTTRILTINYDVMATTGNDVMAALATFETANPGLFTHFGGGSGLVGADINSPGVFSEFMNGRWAGDAIGFSYFVEGKILTLAETIGSGKVVQLGIIYEPEVIVQATHQDFNEVEKVPCIIINSIEIQHAVPLQREDYVLNKATGAALVVPPPYQGDIVFKVDILTPGSIDLVRLSEAMMEYAENNPKLASKALGESFRFWLKEEFSNDTRPGSNDVAMARLSGEISNVVFFKRPAQTGYGVERVKFVTKPNPRVRVSTVSSPINDGSDFIGPDIFNNLMFLWFNFQGMPQHSGAHSLHWELLTPDATLWATGNTTFNDDGNVTFAQLDFLQIVPFQIYGRWVMHVWVDIFSPQLDVNETVRRDFVIHE